MGDGESITLHSSWRGIITSMFGALIVLAIGVAAVAASGPGVVTVVVLAVGAILTLGVAFDYPVRSTFDATGVTRRAMLRHHRIEWDDVRQLSRTRPGLVMSLRKLRLGGLVAVVGKRRYLLVDQGESGPEHDHLDAVLGETAAAVGLDVIIRPGDNVAPTWIYRSKQWQPPES